MPRKPGQYPVQTCRGSRMIGIAKPMVVGIAISCVSIREPNRLLGRGDQAPVNRAATHLRIAAASGALVTLPFIATTWSPGFGAKSGLLRMSNVHAPPTGTVAGPSTWFLVMFLIVST